MTARTAHRFRPALVLAMVALGLLALTPLASRLWDDAVDRHWLARIETLPEVQAIDLLEKLAQDRARLPMLAQLVANHRPHLAQTAHALLLSDIDAWHADDPADLRRARQVARTLSDCFAGAAQPGSQLATDIAGEICNWQKSGNQADLALMEDCEKVLALTRQQHASSEPAALVGETLRAIDEMAAAPLLPTAWIEPLELAEAKVRSSDANSTDREAEFADDSSQAAPEQFIPPPEARSLTSGQEGSLHVDVHPLATDNRTAGQQVIRLATSATADGADPVADLLEQARASGNVSGALLQQLSDLNLNEKETALFRELAASDSSRRKALAESLPEMQGLNSRRWLKLVAADRDPQVRLTAMSLLMTTGDPALERFVRERAARDTDERVRNQLGR